MIKRIYCFLFAFVMLAVSCNFQTYAAAEPTPKYSYAVKVVTGLGLADGSGEGFDWSKNITRGEICDIVYKILRYSDYDDVSGQWHSNFYGDKDANNQLITDMTDNSVYSDVLSDNTYYSAIRYLSDTGIVRGFDDGTFRPDAEIKSIELGKIIVRMLGYETIANKLGSGDDGYKQILKTLEIMSDTNGTMSREETAQVIYNMLVTEKAWNTDFMSFELKNDAKTAMEKYLGISYTKGVMTDNGYVSFAGGSAVGKDNVIIGGMRLNKTAKVKNIHKYLGHELEVFYGAEDSQTPQEIKLVFESGRDTCEVIYGRDVKEFKSETLYYSVGNKNKNVKIDSGTTVIRNNELITTYTESLFTSKSSVINVITASDKKKIVIINDYESIVVADKTETSLYNKIRYTGETNVIDVDESKKDILVFAADGKESSLDAIKTDSVLDILTGGELTEIYISDKSEYDFIVKAIDGTGDDVSFSNGETEINVYSKMYEKATNRPEINMGVSYHVLMNKSGEIVWWTPNDTEKLNFVFMYRGFVDESGDGISIKCLNSGNEWKNLKLAEKVTFSDNTGAEKRYSAVELYKATLSNYSGFLRYKKDKDENVTYIEIPITDKSSEADNKLRFLANTGIEDPNRGLVGTVWRTASGNIGPDVIVGSSSTVLTINPQVTGTEAYKFQKNVFVDYEYYILDAFTTKKDANFAEYVSLISEKNTAGLKNTKKDVAVVKDIKEVYDEDEDEILTQLTLYDMAENKAGQEKTLSLSSNDNVLSNIKNMLIFATPSEDTKRYTLGIGDVIRYATDAYDKITEIQLVWDADKKNTISPNARKGGIPGVIDYFSSAENGKTNPLGFVGMSEGKYVLNPNQIADLNYRVFDGYAVRVVDDVLTVTTQELSINPYDKLESDDRFVTESYSLNNARLFNAMTISSNGKVTSCRQATVSDIKPETVYGTDCSSILIIGANGGVARILIINYEE